MSLVPWLLAIPLTIFAMGGWRKLVPLIFGKRKHILGARMLGLANQAQFLVWFAICGAGGTTSDARCQRAAVIANALFSTIAANDPAIEQEAMAWLEANPRYRELVVQSLRVHIMAKECLGDPEDHFASLFQKPIFLRFAPEYPAVPSPQSYESMVQLMLAELPADARTAIQARFQ